MDENVIPSISVIVPVFNGEGVLERCLRSIKDSCFDECGNSCTRGEKRNGFELIVVDDGSHDGTGEIAAQYADLVIKHGFNRGEPLARNSGFKAARAEIIVNVDADVLIKPDTLARICGYFIRHPEIDGLTGMLDKSHPHSGFFSQYKNLYMHYTFGILPRRVAFLYGSLFALRRSALQDCDTDFKYISDTELGQRVASLGHNIICAKDLQVIHLKRHGLISLIRNDFNIPFHWARLFMKYEGWRQVGKSSFGFAHSSKRQLFGVCAAGLSAFAAACFLAGGKAFLIPLAVLTAVWMASVAPFIIFIVREKGYRFAAMSVLFTFLDQIVMVIGILSGFINVLMKRAGKNRKNNGSD